MKVKGSIPSAVMLADDLQAGFRLNHIGTEKVYAGFTVVRIEGEDIKVTYSRDCTVAEKRMLAKMVYGEQSVKSIAAQTDMGYPCKLFMNK